LEEFHKNNNKKNVNNLEQEKKSKEPNMKYKKNVLSNFPQKKTNNSNPIQNFLKIFYPIKILKRSK